MTPTTQSNPAPATPRPYAGADWLKDQQRYLKSQAISPFGERVADLLGELFRGLYHWHGWRSVDWADERHIRVVVGWTDWSTYDGDNLTRLVFLAHREAIRVSIEPCNFRHIALLFFPRRHDGERIYDRHPTLRQAVEAFEATGGVAS